MAAAKETPRRVAIVGSRSGAPTTVLRRLIDRLPASATVVSGGARGVDTQAAMLARERGLAVVELRPDYDAHGTMAPLVRNREIAMQCDEMHAFWDGRSRGTEHAMRCARHEGKIVTVHRVP